MLTGDDDKDQNQDTQEDTQEDTTTEDTSTEESDDSESTEEDKEDDSKEDDSGKEFSKKLKFSDLDPAKLPKELIPHYKRMQASYTRGMQKAALVTKKAEALDALAEEPDFQEWLQAKQAGTLSKVKRNKSSDDDDDDDTTPLTKKDMKAFLTEFQGNQEKAAEAKRVKESIIAEGKQFLKDNPNAKNFLDDIGEVLRKHPTFTYEEAWRWVQLQDEDIAESLRDSKRRANSTKPNRTQGREPEKKEAPTIKSAARNAAKALGIKWEGD